MTYELKKPEQVILECPFCGKKTISATFIPSMLQSHTSRTASQKKTKFYKTKEKYEINSGCPDCGKSQKDIEKAIKEGKSDAKRDEKILKRLKEQGIIKGEITTKF